MGSKIGQLVSSLIVTAIGVAVIFRIDMVRSLVTGIQSAKPGSLPATASQLYM